jgi:hypothetical protein
LLKEKDSVIAKQAKVTGVLIYLESTQVSILNNILPFFIIGSAYREKKR